MQSLKEYWKAYGGTEAFFLSSYLHLSILLTTLLYLYVPQTPENLQFPLFASLQSAPPLLG